MNKINTSQDEAFSLDEALTELRKGLSPDVVEKIHERALAMAMGQYLSSTHETEDHQQILAAINDGDMDCLERFEVDSWQPFEDESPEDIFSMITSAAFLFEENLLWACGLNKATKTPVPVARWDAYEGGVSPPCTHEISIDDQRASNGQVFIDISKIKVLQESSEISPAVTIEVQNLQNMLNAEKAGITRNIDVPVVHLHFDNSNLAASFFHDHLGGDRSRFLMRMEAGAMVTHLFGDVFEVTSRDFE